MNKVLRQNTNRTGFQVISKRLLINISNDSFKVSIIVFSYCSLAEPGPNTNTCIQHQCMADVFEIISFQRWVYMRKFNGGVVTSLLKISSCCYEPPRHISKRTFDSRWLCFCWKTYPYGEFAVPRAFPNTRILAATSSQQTLGKVKLTHVTGSSTDDRKCFDRSV